MEPFACCSRWQECQVEQRCIHPGTKENAPEEWRVACTTAKKYTKPMQRKTLLLVDGNSLLHRAYYATPPLHSPCGKPTNAVYGTIRMLSRLISEKKPTHLAVAFDGEGGSFRKKLYSEYKAQRKPTPPEILTQMETMMDVLECSGIKCLHLPEYEADDIIGTMSARAAVAGCQVIIVTGDRDMLQLVNRKATVLLMRKGVSELLECNPETTEELTGVQPARIVDLKALAGDKSDNIPGAAGVGGKTARVLLERYGDVETVLERIEEIPGSTGEKLRASVERIRLSKSLATIRCDAPIAVTPDDCELTVNMVRLRKRLGELGIYNVNMAPFIVYDKKHYTVDRSLTIVGAFGNGAVREDVETLGKVQLRCEGNPRFCGVCGLPSRGCNKFIELQNGRLVIGATTFWACSKCQEILNPAIYLMISAPGRRK